MFIILDFCFNPVWQYVEEYGWFIIGIVVAVLLLKNRLQPQLDRWRSQREDGRNKKIGWSSSEYLCNTVYSGMICLKYLILK